MKHIFKYMSLLLACFVLPCVLSQRSGTPRCGRRPSQESPGAYDVYCSCMQKIVELNSAIHMLTVDQTDCNSLAVNVNWNALQTYIGVKKVVFKGAVINIINDSNEMRNCTVEELIFDKSRLVSIAANAFNGLKSLETIRIVNSSVGTIGSESFSGYKFLKTIEFASTNIARIDDEAFTDLPLIEDLAFVNCTIETVAKNAISIINEPRQPKAEICPLGRRDAGNSLLEMARILEGVTLSGRSLEHVDDVIFPEFGAKLLFFTSKIKIIEKSSIETNAFPYIILGGNEIEVVETDAIKAEIKNDCDISSFLLIANKISYIEPMAFAGITGDKKSSFYDTVFAVVDNVFNVVERKGFLIDSRLSTHYVKGNKFTCSCDMFPWILSDFDSEVQIDLERKLVETGFCAEDEPLIPFLEQCGNVTKVMKELATTTEAGNDKERPTIPSKAEEGHLVGSGETIMHKLTVFSIVLSFICSQLI